MYSSRGKGATLVFRVIGEELATYIMYENLSKWKPSRLSNVREYAGSTLQETKLVEWIFLPSETMEKP